MYIDTHTHLYSSAFDEDREQIIEKAQKTGVQKFFLPAIDSSTHEAMLNLEKKYPHTIFAMMGLHPVDVKFDTYKKELSIVENYIQQRDFIAIGEIGIDLYWDSSTLEIQQEAFSQQIDWALEKNWPIVIHCRDAFDEVFEVLDHKSQKINGVFHCFTGTENQALHAIDLGLKLGIGGVATFKNGKIDQFLNQIDIQNIVLETDSPYLAPVPVRGKRNDSSFLPYIAEKLAEIYGISLAEIGRITTQNALEVFQIQR